MKSKTKAQKKDAKPILIMIITYIAGGFLLSILSEITGKNFDVSGNTDSEFVMFLISAIAFIILIFLYWKKLLKEGKKLNSKDLLKLLLIAVGLILFSHMAEIIFEHFNVETTNQDMIDEGFKVSPILNAITVSIFSPISEELAFRYALSTCIKNEKAFLIISSILFGAAHGIGIATIIYIIAGFALGLVYLKHKRNVTAPIVVHFINNLVSTVTSLI